VEVNIYDFDRVVARIECGTECGSAFFLKGDLIATCRHCILPHLLDETPIYAHFGDEKILVVVCEPFIPEAYDTVFLRPARAVEGVSAIPLVASHLPRGLSWESFGFPGERGERGMLIRGSVVPFINAGSTPRDVELECERSDQISDYRGFSGAPLVVDGTVRGMLQRRLDGGIGAISLARLQGYLVAADVRFRSQIEIEHLPPSLAREVESTIPNSRSLCQLEEELSERHNGYLVLTGHPGAGKTLIVASFRPTGDHMLVVGRYFSGGYVGSDLTPAYYRQLSTFAQWLSNQASLRTSQAVAVRPDFATGDFAKSVIANMNAIGASFSGELHGVLLIDGVDAAHADTLPGFLEYLPVAPPRGLAIVITTSDSASLVKKAGHLRIAKEIFTQPLPRNDCERLVRSRVAYPLRPSEAARIAELSEGHPLTLSYFINEFVAATERGDEDPGAVLEGGPQEYYQRVWNRFSDGSPTQYLLSLIASLRGAVSEDELVKMLPASQKTAFINSFESIRYLFRVDQGSVRFYHESFRDFITAQATSSLDDIHATLVHYCESAANSEYALTNFLYHHLRSSTDRQEVSRRCTQDWLDRAASRCAHPELLLSDVEEVLRNRLEEGDLRETVRLLLLRSRIHYRYNQVFAMFAADFAKAAISLRGPDQALRFIVRQGYHICSFEETLSLLRSLCASGHLAQAEEMYRDLRMRFWAACEAGAMHYEGLVSQMAATWIVGLASHADDLRPLTEDLHALSRLLRSNLDSGAESEAATRHIRSLAHATIAGECLWATGFALTKADDPVEVAVTLESADRIARCDGSVEHRANRPEPPGPLKALGRSELGQALKSLASDADIGSGDAAIVARALIRNSDAFETVRAIYRASMPLIVDMNLRSDNGVDPNLSNVSKALLANEVRGYTLDPSISDRISYVTRHAWEDRLFEAITWLGGECGRRYRQRALGESAELTFVEILRLEFLPQISFSLHERSEWEDACHIPEVILPELLTYAASVLADLEPTSCSRYAELILDHAQPQFGLYTEGYTRLLGSIANALGVTPLGIQPAADVRRAMLQHIITRVFARQERVAGLLDCAQHLARLGAAEDAERAFQGAVDSSLGPNWYKEDQFRLIVDAIEAVDDSKFSLSQWKKTIELLAYASGESTFQRFVRDVKGDLIGLLSKHGHLSEAFETYRHYLLPSYELQESRIKRVDVDKTTKLAGNQFGLQEVDEQRASLELLSGLGGASPLKRWAVVELFWPWGDDRYAPEFVKELCDLLTSEKSQQIGPRLLRLLRAEVSPDRRAEFVAGIRRHDAAGVTERWLQAAMDSGIIGDPTDDSMSPESEMSTSDRPSTSAQETDETDDKELFLPGTFGHRADLRALEVAVELAGRRIARHDFETARSLLRDGLRQAQRGGWNIWEGLHQAKTALTRMLLQTGSMQKGLIALAECVMKEERVEHWRIARRLMMIGMRQLDADGRQGLFNIVGEHIDGLVKPERQHVIVSSEAASLPDEAQVLSPDQCVEKWIILLMDHPNCHMRARAAGVAMWLAGESDFEIQSLADCIATDAIGHGKEIATGIIHALVTRTPALADSIAKLDNFAFLSTNPNILVRTVADELLGKTRIRDAPESSPVVADPQQLPPMDFSFDANDLLGMKSGSHIGAARLAGELIAPFSADELRELIDIRGRAFGSGPPSRGYAFEREAIFRALGDIPDSSVRRKLIESSLWNPRWPDDDLRLDWADRASVILEKIKRADLESAFAIGDKIVLHCFEVEPSEGGSHLKMTEVVGVLVCKEYFEGSLNCDNLWQSISVFDSEPPVSVVAPLATVQEPAIARFMPEIRIGGDLTPAVPSSRMTQLLGNDGFERVNWIDGRRWDIWGPGPSLSRGTALLMHADRASLIQDYDLVWAIFIDWDLAYIVDRRRGKVYRGSHED